MGLGMFRTSAGTAAAPDSAQAAPSQWQWLTLGGWGGAPAAADPHAAAGPPRPDWMSTLPGLSILAGTPGVHFSARSGAPAPGPQAEEPAVSTTLDVECGSLKEEDELLGAEDEGQAAPPSETVCLSDGDGKPTLADYPARKRSREDERLPLTVEKGMLEIKRLLWGTAHGGMERRQWKNVFASEAQRHHDDRVQRANQRCCPTEAMNALVQCM